MASQTLGLGIPSRLCPRPTLSLPCARKHLLPNPVSLFLPSLPKHGNPSFVSLPSLPRSKPLSLSLRHKPPPKPIILKKSRVFAPSSTTDDSSNNSSHDRSISTILTMAIPTAVSGSLLPSPEELVMIDSLQKSLVLCSCTVGPLFFAALSERWGGSPSDGYLMMISTLMTEVAAAMAKWLRVCSEILAERWRGSPSGGFLMRTLMRSLAAGMGKWLKLYSEILSVRCLLSWFPNIPWERQPFSAMRDLCDPFLCIFMTIIPPIYGLDVSSLLAFAVLGTVASILNTPPPS